MKSSTSVFKKQPRRRLKACSDRTETGMNHLKNSISAARAYAFGSLCAIALLAAVLTAPALAAPPAEGTQAPAFTLASLTAPHWTLGGTRGHVVVVNFFATWCPPCRAETPDLVAAEKRYAGKGVIFVGVDASENASLVSVFVKSKGIRYPIVLDSSDVVSKT